MFDFVWRYGVRVRWQFIAALALLAICILVFDGCSPSRISVEEDKRLRQASDRAYAATIPAENEALRRGLLNSPPAKTAPTKKPVHTEKY